MEGGAPMAADRRPRYGGEGGRPSQPAARADTATRRLIRQPRIGRAEPDSGSRHRGPGARGTTAGPSSGGMESATRRVVRRQEGDAGRGTESRARSADASGGGYRATT
ncbi:hypothetical protein GCM10010254_37590 [Streptomyces chromofuscus]|nr:hypothetical protein GCM10010254_37590 [Streptomyces chromofuscus]